MSGAVTVQAIVADHRRDDQHRDLVWSLDELADVQDEIGDLVTTLEDPETTLTVAQIRPLIEQAEKRLARSRLVLERTLVEAGL